MKKIQLTLSALFLGLLMCATSNAETRYGKTVETTIHYDNGNSRTTYTCPPTSDNVCQIWGTNADGSRFCIVRKTDGSTIGVNVQRAVLPPELDPISKGIYVRDQSGVWYQEITPRGAQ